MDRFSADHFNNDDAARAYLKACCGRMVRFARIAARSTMPMPPSGRACIAAPRSCRKDFTVTTGTVMERCKIACTSG